MQLFAPFFVVLLLFVLTIIVQEGQTPEQYVNPRVTAYNPSQFRRCYPKYTKKCVTLRYTTNGDLFASNIMTRVLAKLTHIPQSEIVEHVDTSEMIDAFNAQPNGTLYGVTFLGDEPYSQSMLNFLGTEENTTATRYIVYYNSTSDDIVHENVVLQTLIDNSISTLRLGLPDKDIFVANRQGWPKPEDLTNGQLSVFSLTGPQFFSICCMCAHITCYVCLLMYSKYVY